MPEQDIRDIINKQGVEAALCHVYEMLDALTKQREQPIVPPAESPPLIPVVEGEEK